MIFFPCLKYNRKIDTDVVGTVGKQKSIGLLIMASGSAEDQAIPGGPPYDAGQVLTPVGLINFSNTTDMVGERGKQSL